MLVIRAYGNILYAVGQWGGAPGQALVDLEPQHLDAWMEDCRRHGVSTVLWRANCAGTLTYPSQYTALAGEPPLPHPNRGVGVAVIDQGWTVRDWEVLGAQCRNFHTLEAAVQAAHRCGLTLYLDFSTLDMVGSWCTQPEWPGGGQRAFDPDQWLWSRDQRRRLAGVPCYADPLVRQHRVAEISEALGTGVDGVWLGFFSHVDGMAGEQRYGFGYNPEVVEEYAARYGTYPRPNAEDAHRLFALHGEHYTRFVRQVSQVVRGAGRRLLATARTDGVHGWGAAEAGGCILGQLGSQDRRDGRSELPFAAGLYLEWETWAAEGLVDGLVFWAPWEGGLEALQQLRQKAGVPVSLFRKFAGWGGQVRPPHTLEQYRREARAVDEGRLDGYCLHVSVAVPHPQARPSWREVFA